MSSTCVSSFLPLIVPTCVHLLLSINSPCLLLSLSHHCFLAWFVHRTSCLVFCFMRSLSSDFLFYALCHFSLFKSLHLFFLFFFVLHEYPLFFFYSLKSIFFVVCFWVLPNPSSCCGRFLSHRFFLSRDLWVAADRITFSLAPLVFSCTVDTLSNWNSPPQHCSQTFSRFRRGAFTISRSFRSALSSRSCCSIPNRSARGISKKMSWML